MSFLLFFNIRCIFTIFDRKQWADYFDQQGVQYAFFSAANATALQQARREALAEAAEQIHSETMQEEDVVNSEDDSSDPRPGQESEKREDAEEEQEFGDDVSSSSDISFHDGQSLLMEDDSPDAKDPRARVLSVLELEQLFVNAAPDLSGEPYQKNDSQRHFLDRYLLCSFH